MTELWLLDQPSRDIVDKQIIRCALNATLRAHLQSIVWSMARVAKPNLRSPVQYGFSSCDQAGSSTGSCGRVGAMQLQ